MPAHEKRPSSDPPANEQVRSIQEEHDELRAMLRDIQEAGLAELPPLLAQLRELLVEHFETEEGPDGLEAITKKQPQFLPRLAEIFDEHRVFLERLDGLATRAENCAREQESVLSDVRSLAQELHEHEAKENELLGDVLYTDLGGSA